jgi:hypothetical protein
MGVTVMRKAPMLPAVLVGVVLLYFFAFHRAYFPLAVATAMLLLTFWMAHLALSAWRTARASPGNREARTFAVLLLLLTVALAYCAYLAFNAPA